jgi:AraC-like DNA-binding protein
MVETGLRTMGHSRTKQFDTGPEAGGAISRLAYAHASAKGADADVLLREAGLSRGQIDDPDCRFEVRRQIKFLNLVAGALSDDLLGFHLSQDFDPRSMGLLHYVLASSDTLNEAIRRAARYSSIINEGIRLSQRVGEEIGVTFEYVGVSRHLDRHQIEFWMAALIRTCRQLTDRHFTADHVSFIHRRSVTPEEKAFYSCKLMFGADVDEARFSPSILDAPIVSADPYLNKLLIKYCEEALAHRRTNRNPFETKVENAIAVLLPHGKTQVSEVARKLGMSERTLARRLASEGLTFTGVLRALRSDLAKRHLADNDLSISKIAWLLGYSDSSAFSTAYKRHAGIAPSAIRQRAKQNRLPA